MKKILIILLLLILVGCNRPNNMPSNAIIKEYQISSFITENGIYVEDAKYLLDQYGIENNYVTGSMAVVEVYLAKSDATGKYYEIYTPSPTKYDVVVVEAFVPDFSVIEEKVNEYNSIDDIEMIDLCVDSDYCGLTTTLLFMDRENQDVVDFLGEMESPILLAIGQLSSDFATIFLGRYGLGEFVLLCYDSSSGGIAILLEFSV